MKHLILAVQLGGAKAADVVHLLATGQSWIHRDADVPHAVTRLDCIATDASCLLQMNSEFNMSKIKLGRHHFADAVDGVALQELLSVCRRFGSSLGSQKYHIKSNWCCHKCTHLEWSVLSSGAQSAVDGWLMLNGIQSRVLVSVLLLASIQTLAMPPGERIQHTMKSMNLISWRQRC